MAFYENLERLGAIAALFFGSSHAGYGKSGLALVF